MPPGTHRLPPEYFERIARELEEIAEVLRARRDIDRDLPRRLMRIVLDIRLDVVADREKAA